MRHKAVLIWESVHGVDNVFVSLRTCVLQYKDVFPVCFLCVFFRNERFLCSHVCWQEVRHTCTRPQLVSFRILCSVASTIIFVQFSVPSFLFFCSFQGLWTGSLCLFYMPCFFIYITFLHLCMPCLILDWLYDRGDIVRTASHCVPFDPASLPVLHQTPTGGSEPRFPCLETN